MTEETQILKQILAACERTVAACERLTDVAEERRHERKTGQAATAPPAEKKKRAPKGEVYTVTGKVINFSLVTGASGSPILTKNNTTMTKLKLDGGFETTIFGDDIGTMSVINEAWSSGAMLEVGYTINGKYTNIQSVRVIGAGPATTQVEETDDSTPF